MELIKTAESEKLEYQTRHDEMFNSVSTLNSRIEELEQHKIHLLQKLKSYGDKGGLEYIIKTQKLENVEGRKIDNRVQVAEYNPESKRAEHDAVYEQ